jgi:hypothetical protein
MWLVDSKRAGVAVQRRSRHRRALGFFRLTIAQVVAGSCVWAPWRWSIRAEERVSEAFFCFREDIEFQITLNELHYPRIPLPLNLFRRGRSIRTQ